MDQDKIKEAVVTILTELGCDLESSNYKDTPERYVKFLKELFHSKRKDFASFEEHYQELVLLRNHEMWTLCPHHLLPVKLSVNVGYMPNGHVLGLSKLARIIDSFNVKPLLQEDLTNRVVSWFAEDIAKWQGAACKIVGQHMCMTMRGVKTTGDIVTLAWSGTFSNKDRQAQFLDLCR